MSICWTDYPAAKTYDELLAHYGLTSEKIIKTVTGLIG